MSTQAKEVYGKFTQYQNVEYKKGNINSVKNRKRLRNKD